MGKTRIPITYRHLDLFVLFDSDGNAEEIQVYTGRRDRHDQWVYESIGDLFDLEAWNDIAYEAKKIMDEPPEPEPFED